uniref:Uncharacterized protein n=1 Tax=Knipowitschia caucasica TaxID=637954 RepID=A0AAV2KH76_KNICA
MQRPVGPQHQAWRWDSWLAELGDGAWLCYGPFNHAVGTNSQGGRLGSLALVLPVKSAAWDSTPSYFRLSFGLGAMDIVPFKRVGPTSRLSLDSCYVSWPEYVSADGTKHQREFGLRRGYRVSAVGPYSRRKCWISWLWYVPFKFSAGRTNIRLSLASVAMSVASGSNFSGEFVDYVASVRSPLSSERGTNIRHVFDLRGYERVRTNIRSEFGVVAIGTLPF